MQINKTRTILFIAATGLILTIGACAGRYCQRDPEQQSTWLMEEASEVLKLDNAQQAKFKVFVDELTDSRKTLRSQRRQTRETLMGLLTQPSFDRQKSLNLLESHIRTMQARAPRLVSSFADFYDSLSGEQRQALREELDDHFDHHHYKHHW